MENSISPSIPISTEPGVANTPDSKEKTNKFLLWLGLVSIAMLFAGLTSGYIVRRETGNWLRFNLPVQFWFSTAVILLSSITMNWGLSSAKKGNFRILPNTLLATFIFGVVFTLLQFLAWGALVRANVYAMGSQSSSSGSFLYIISGLHIAHIFGGLIALLVVYFNSLKGKYSASNYLGVKLCATYWHYLDALWLYLFIFLLLFR